MRPYRYSAEDSIFAWEFEQQHDQDFPRKYYAQKIYLSFLARCLIHSLNIQYHIKSFVVMRNKRS
jgi:hypothetical protein